MSAQSLTMLKGVHKIVDYADTMSAQSLTMLKRVREIVDYIDTVSAHLFTMRTQSKNHFTFEKKFKVKVTKAKKIV